MDLVVGGYLLELSIEDVRKRKLPLWILIVGIMGSALYGLKYIGVFGMLAGILPGVILLIISALLPHSIGTGDGILTVIYGAVYGWKRACIWLMFGFFGAAVFGLFYCLCQREKHMKLPLVPFLTLIHVGMCL